jgi:hypothetical protein
MCWRRTNQGRLRQGKYPPIQIKLNRRQRDREALAARGVAADGPKSPEQLHEVRISPHPLWET